ncbi:MAG: hypothetical protein OEV44_11735, partial [Spirochaetota bacterium]|nr:hypothetical protein [Spirochaetota bacterium]
MMSTEKKYSHVKNKTFLIFFIICLAIISFPLIAIYSNTNLYLTSSNDFMKKVDKQFSQVIDNTKDTAIDKKILSNLHFEI